MTLLPALHSFSSAALLDSGAAKIASRPEAFHPSAIVFPGIGKVLAKKQIAASLETSLRRLWSSAAEYLLSRSKVPPQPAADRRLDAGSCAGCGELHAFALNPREQLHWYVTEPAGSPQTLVCTKNRRGYLTRKSEHEQGISAMRKPVDIAHECGEPHLATRLEDAVRRAESA